MGNDGAVTSMDGMTWSTVDTRNLRGVIWAGSQFVATGANGVILRSDCSSKQSPTNTTLTFQSNRSVRSHAMNPRSLLSCGNTIAKAHVTATNAGQPTGQVDFQVNDVLKSTFFNLGTDGDATYTACLDSGSRVKASYRGSNSYQPSSVTVLFNTTFYTLTIHPTGGGSGTVTSSLGGINCGADCTENYSSGTPITLTATPLVGSRFTGWSGGVCSGTEKTCIVAMSSTRNVTATFTATPPDLKVTGITLIPISPMENSTFQARITVRNHGGTASAIGVTLAVWSDNTGTPLCNAVGNKSVAVGILASGESRSFILRGLSAGSIGGKTLLAFIDSTCAVPEVNEGNNQIHRTYTVH